MTSEQSRLPFDWILQSVFSSKEEQLDPSYVAAEADLDAYVEMQLDGKDADERYPHVRPALTQYEDLQEAYESLLSLLADERNGLLAKPAGEPEFDLSFIQRDTALWEQVNTGNNSLSRFLHEIHVRLGQVAATFGQLPPMLTPQIVMVPVRADEQAQSEALDIDALDHRLSLRLQLGPTSQGKAIINVRISAVGDDPDPTGRRARVTLLDDKDQMLVSANVDRSGWVTFRDIDAGHYVVRVTDQSGVLELPVSIDPLSPDS